MANYTPYIKRLWNMHIPTIWGDITAKKDPDVFTPNGSQIYHGYQGEGKTLSMYHAGSKLKARYPRAMLVSNLHLRDFVAVRVATSQELVEALKTFDAEKQYFFFESHTDLMLVLREVRNGEYGVIFMIDEIHNYFHSHDSKSMPMWVVQVFSQQRKQRLVILGTVQLWPDVIKAIRDQVDNLIGCSRRGHLISQTAIDPRTAESNYGETEFVIRKKGFFWITRAIREGYDTYQVINSGREIMGGNDLMIGNVPANGKVKKPKQNRQQYDRKYN